MALQERGCVCVCCGSTSVELPHQDKLIASTCAAFDLESLDFIASLTPLSLKHLKKHNKI